MGSSMVTIGQSALGAGLFAAQALQPGQAILLLSGAVLSRDEIVALGSERSYAIQIGPDEYLDTMPPGRYANHSCNPNAGIKNDRVLMALRPVAAGEEIRFDYSTAMGRGHWTTECRCGEPSCRGVILDFHHLPPITQNRYLPLGIVERFIVEQVRRRSPARRVVRRTRVLGQVSL